jgi:hypothetical protein
LNALQRFVHDRNGLVKQKLGAPALLRGWVQCCEGLSPQCQQHIVEHADFAALCESSAEHFGDRIEKCITGFGPQAGDEPAEKPALPACSGRSQASPRRPCDFGEDELTPLDEGSLEVLPLATEPRQNHRGPLASRETPTRCTHHELGRQHGALRGRNAIQKIHGDLHRSRAELDHRLSHGR